MQLIRRVVETSDNSQSFSSQHPAPIPSQKPPGPWQRVRPHADHLSEVFVREAVAGAAPRLDQRAGKSKFEELAEAVKGDPNPDRRYGPFADRREWQLVEWLISTSVSQGNIDKFLKLELVRTFSFPFLANYH